MHFTIQQSIFNAQLQAISRIIPGRPSHPILSHVLIECDEKTQKVTLTGFDLAIGLRISFDATVKSPGLITVPAKLLSDIVSRLPDGDVTFELLGENTIAVISSSGRYEVSALLADDYPALPDVTDVEAVELPSELLLSGFGGTLFATSSDETKQVLTGVHIAKVKDGIEFAATCGHRLSVVKVAGGNDLAADFELTIPSKAAHEIMQIADRVKEPAKLTFDRAQLICEWPNQRLTARLLEGQYPNYRQLIPTQFIRQITVDRRVLASALERASIVASEKNNVVKLSIDSKAQQIVVKAEAEGLGNAREEVPCQVTGDDLDIAFNVKYLLEGLKNLPGSEVLIQCNTATSPVVLTPMGDAKMTYLVMPVACR